MQDVHQSQMYRNYMQNIGWVVDTIDDTQIFIKRFPLIGSIIKIQRQNKTPTIDTINSIGRKYRAWSISIESLITTNYSQLTTNNFKINNNPYLPTKTIQIDLTTDENKIFNRFSEAKRRAVRRDTFSERPSWSHRRDSSAVRPATGCFRCGP